MKKCHKEIKNDAYNLKTCGRGVRKLQRVQLKVYFSVLKAITTKGERRRRKKRKRESGEKIQEIRHPAR